MRAADGDAGGRQALGELCERYWQPVYRLYRRRGVDAERAADLTQGLFAHLLERGDFARADPSRGRFRAYLRTCAEHWLARQHEHDHAHKRGGGARLLSFDAAGEETRLRLEPSYPDEPAAAFERRWAEAVVERARWRLEQEERTARRERQFTALAFVLDGQPPPRSWADLARELETTEGALKVAAHRLKARFRDALCAEVRDTLADDVAPGDELRELLAAFGGSAAAESGEGP